MWLPSVNLYESTVPFSEKVSTVTPTHPTAILSTKSGVSDNSMSKIFPDL